MKKLTPKQRLFVHEYLVAKVSALYQLGLMYGMWGRGRGHSGPVEADPQLVAGLLESFLAEGKLPVQRFAIAMLLDYYRPEWRQEIDLRLLWPVATRDSAEARAWRMAVLARDGRCRKCGVTSDLEAHHVIPWAIAPELRTDVNNGMALCEVCHLEETTRRGH